MRPVRALSRQAGRTAAALALACACTLSACSGNPLEAMQGLLGGGASGSASDGATSASASSDATAQLANAKAQAIPDESLVEAGTLTVGLLTDSVGAPFIISGSGSSIEGIDIDLAADIASDLGLLVRFVSVGSVDGALAYNNCDIVMDVSTERAGTATVLGGYYEVASAFFHKGTETVVSTNDLNGHSVAVQAGSVSESALNSTVLDMARKQYANLNEAFEALAAGEVDYVLCEAYPGAYLASAYEGVSFAGALSAPASLGIAASTNNPEVQEAVKGSLDAILNNGVYDIVRGRWLGGMGEISADKVIQGVPQAEQPAASGEAENVEGGASQDGSGAGANAVFVPNEL